MTFLFFWLFFHSLNYHYYHVITKPPLILLDLLILLALLGWNAFELSWLVSSVTTTTRLFCSSLMTCHDYYVDDEHVTAHRSLHCDDIINVLWRSNNTSQVKNLWCYYFFVLKFISDRISDTYNMKKNWLCCDNRKFLWYGKTYKGRDELTLQVSQSTVNSSWKIEYV